MKTRKIRALIISILFLIGGGVSNAQTFECYIDNDTFISTTQFEFDVLIKSTSTDFLFNPMDAALRKIKLTPSIFLW